ncbi:tape measure protein [Xenorhabdus szentirmaii]|uniref:Membrane protein n=1 Tax=Xenorhabdus szentirmaii DSM 16338 TaxID=1427518 RepID=W1IT36_9GAMM|nr:tape measure protein [Xenorhabdus szentirmaii]PHM30516.1 phage tail tape measure protein [Xenorhabdus szentirmaii DSM 16338]CDL80973.1 putative membrane protein [Xenorhabdus szentirmaii DSM 16338]
MADSLGFRLSLDSKEFEIKIDNAGRLLNRLSNQGTKASTGVKRLEGGFRGFNRTLSDTITTIGMASFAIGTLKTALFDWQKTILDSAGKLERLQVMLQGLATSSDKAAESMRDFNFIIDKAKNAPFSIESISDSFVKLKSAGIDPTKGSLDAMVDSVARFGGDSELLKRATIAIQQMSGKGVISMEELRQQLGEAIPTAMQSMATSMNLSMGELTKAISSGQVEATTAIKGMLNIMEISYRGSAQRMMSTYSGLVSQMQTNAALMAKSIGDAGYMDAVKDALKDINRLLMSDAASYYGKQFGEMVTGFIDVAREMLTWVVNNQSALTSLLKILLLIGGTKIFLSFLKTTIGSITSFNRAIATTITGGGGGLISFGRHISTVAERSQRMGGSLNVATVAIGQMAYAWRSLNMAMKANIIIAAITTVIEIVAALAWWFGQAEQKAIDATEAARNMPSMVTDEQLALLKAKLKEQKEVLDRSNKELNDALEHREQIYNNKKSGLIVTDSVIEGVEKKYTDALKKQQDSQKDYDNNQDLIRASELARAKEHMRKKLELVMEENQKAANIRQADYQKKRSDIEKQRDADLQTNKDSTERQAEIRKKAAEDLGAAYDEEVEAQRLGLVKVRDVIGKQQEEINKKIADRTAELGDAVAAKNDVFLQKLISQKEEIGKHYYDIANQIGNLAQMVKDGKELMFNGWKGLDGNFNDGANDALEKRLSTIRKNNERLSLGDRINSGEKVATIDGRIAKGEKEAEANFQIIEALVGKKIAVDNLSEAYAKLSVAEKKEIDVALANARIQDEADRRKSSHQGESKEAKAKRLAEKMAEENKKILDQAESVAEKVGFGSTEVIKYKQSIDALTKSLSKLGSSKPEDGILSQEQIDKAKAQLAEITAGADDYQKALTKDSADQLISKWAGFANTVKGNMTQSVAEMRSEFEKNHQEADEYFAKIIKANENNIEISKYLKAEQAKFHVGKEEAMVRMTETATARMAYDYQNLGKLIDENMKNIFDNLEDKLMEFLDTGKFNIADFGNFIFKELQRSFIRSMVISPMINGLGLGAGGDTGESLISKIGGAVGSIGSMFGGSSAKEGDDGIAKSTQALGKAATETTGALKTMQSDGIFSTIAGYAQQLWAMITGTTATQTKSAADISATTTVTSFSVALGLARSAVISFIASLTASSSASTAGSIVSMAGTIGSTVAAGYGGGASAGVGAAGSAANTGAMGMSTSWQSYTSTFAKGGIMGSLGEIPLKAYSKGGIATSPQLALFGEGSHNEAYVPLPDGRRIPVNMNIAGDDIGAGSDKNVVISISVVNQGGDKEEKSNSSNESAWNETAQKIKSIVLETMTEEKRPGGMLTE